MTFSLASMSTTSPNAQEPVVHDRPATDDDEEKSLGRLEHVPMAVAVADECDDVRRAFLRKMYAYLVADQSVFLVCVLVFCSAPRCYTIYDWRYPAVIGAGVLTWAARQWYCRRRRCVVGVVTRAAATIAQSLLFSLLLAVIAAFVDYTSNALETGQLEPGRFQSGPHLSRAIFILWSSHFGALVASLCTNKPATRRILAAGAVVGLFAALLGTHTRSLFQLRYDVIVHASLLLAANAYLISDIDYAMASFPAADAPLAAFCLGCSRRDSAALTKAGLLQPLGP